MINLGYNALLNRKPVEIYLQKKTKTGFDGQYILSVRSRSIKYRIERSEETKKFVCRNIKAGHGIR